MVIRFHKMHGTLNDFVVFEDLADEIKLSPTQVARICHRRAGIGADGLIAVRRSPDADFFMDYVNSDGSPAEMCGNGIRCLAKYAYDNRLTDRLELSVETRGGVKKLGLIPGQDGKVARVRVDMGPPVFDPEKIPVSISGAEVPIIDYPLEAEGRTFSSCLVSMGNPHCVIFVDEDPESFPKRFGPAIERHPLFPAKTNVEFVRVLAADRLVMRVWERGSGETLSCGTGAAASTVAAVLKGFVPGRTTVELAGGELDIEWNQSASSVIMTGPADMVYVGQITI